MFKFFRVTLVFLFHFVVGFRYSARRGRATCGTAVHSPRSDAEFDYFLTFNRPNLIV